jgi:hypothetical protein
MSAIGGSWDISNHLLNKPESFFSAPHGLLYLGVAAAIVGSCITFRASKPAYRSYQLLAVPTNLVIAGIAMLLIAGPVDFVWHSAFGLDGLLSPPHFVLIMGMIICSFGSLLGINICTNRNTLNDHRASENSNSKRHSESTNVALFKRRPYVGIFLMVLGIMPLWLSLDGIVGMFTLPFSKTQYFDFNPDSFFAAVLATVSYPFLLSLILVSSFRLGKNTFGIISITGAIFLVINAATAIIPNESLIPTIPFYIINIVPIMAADMLLSIPKWRSIYSILLAGAFLGSIFFMMQYPLITHIYNEVATKQAFVWPSQTSLIYFKIIDSIYPLLLVPGVAMGIIGAIAADRITYHSRSS